MGIEFKSDRLRGEVIPERCVVIEKDARGHFLRLAEADVDTLEVMSVLGAVADGDGTYRFEVDIDSAVSVLSRRFRKVVYRGPRGGLRVAEALPYPKVEGTRPFLRRFDAYRVAAWFPDADTWEVLAYKPGMRRARFVDMLAACPYGEAVTSAPLVLLRAARADGDRFYCSYNTLAGDVDAAWDCGSAEGWSLRLRVERAMAAMGRPLFERAAPGTDVPMSRPRAVWLERRLAWLLGAVAVVDVRHTAQPPRIALGEAAKRLSALSCVYGRPRREVDAVVVVDTQAPLFRRHVLKLAEREGMLDQVAATLAVNDPLRILR